MTVALAAPAPLPAQCDPTTSEVTGFVGVADGSTPPNPFANTNPIPSYPHWWTGPLPGSVTINAFPGVPPYGQGSSAYDFSSVASPYFRERGPGATCERSEDQCIWCHGGFTLLLYSRYGNVKGHVSYSPDGAPAGGAWVVAQENGQVAYADDDGDYDFRGQDFPPENNWGLPVYRQSETGPGEALYHIGVSGHPETFVPVHLTSNSLVIEDFVVERPPGAEEDPRCEEGTGGGPSPSAGGTSNPCGDPPPPPCTVGHPVSVTTGNVDVDQVDATVPGVGLGLRFARSYNSANSSVAERYGVFGPGWNHSYEKRLTFPYSRVLKLRESDGSITYFYGSDDDGYWPSNPHSRERWIEKTSATLYTLHFRKGVQEVYDRRVPSGASARLAGLADAVGNPTALVYDASNRLTRITDAGGRELVLAYSGGQLVGLSGPAGLIATFSYAGNKLGAVSYSDGDLDGQPDGGFSFTYAEGTNGRLQSVADLTGRILESHVYDATGRAIETAVSGEVERYTLAYGTEATTVTDSLGNVTVYEWQRILGRRRITRITGSCGGCGGEGGETQTWSYDAKGRITSYTDALGSVTDYQYDGEGNLVQILGPALDGGVRHRTQYAYDSSGRRVTEVAPNLATIGWTYVAAGPSSITEELGDELIRTTTIEYFPNGKRRRIVDPLGRATRFDHHATGDLASTTDPLDRVTTFEYDAMGRLEKTHLPPTIPGNDSPRTSYDTLGRVWRVTNPNGSFWRTWHDGGGRPVLVHDPEGRATVTEYDAYGRRWKVTDALGGVTEYRYDSMSNLRFLIDPRQSPQPDPPLLATEFRYQDGAGRVTSVIFPGGRTETMTYYDAGRLATRTDREGVTTAFAYDAMGRLTGRSFSDGTAPALYGYDAGGDTGYLTSASNGSDALTWDYDLAGQLLAESSAFHDSTISYQYSLAGERLKLRLNGSDLLTYSYRPDGRLDTLSGASGAAFDFEWDAAGRRARVDFPDGTRTEYGYDLLSRPNLVRLRRGLSIVHEIGYASDDLGNRIWRSAGGVRRDYEYDALSRLVAVDRTQPAPAERIEEYEYDAVGNRVASLAVPQPWLYSERNELISYGSHVLEYDLAGNLVEESDGVSALQFEWDVEGRLTEVRRDLAELSEYRYDPLGRRIAKRVLPGTETRFLYDGEDILREQGPAGTFTYLHGPGVDEPLARESTGGATIYYHADALGSIVRVTDATGETLQTIDYDAFGTPNRSTRADYRYSFTGREWDSETALSFYRARYLETWTGRFISVDPIGFSGGLNFYTYALNDPVNLVDPFGLDVNVCFYPDAAAGLGHVGFGLNGDSGTTGFYSESGLPFGAGSVKPDSQDKKECKKIESPREKDDCMLKCRQRRQAEPGRYNVVNRQCTSFVRDCLMECGLPAGSYSGPSPRRFFENLAPN